MQWVVQCPRRLVALTKDNVHHRKTEGFGCVTRQNWHSSDHQVLELWIGKMAQKAVAPRTDKESEDREKWRRRENEIEGVGLEKRDGQVKKKLRIRKPGAKSKEQAAGSKQQ